MNTRFPKTADFATLDYEQALSELDAGKVEWARLPISHRIGILKDVKASALNASEEWVAMADKAKGITPTSPFAGEEWYTGPYAVQIACTELIGTLSQMEGRRYLTPLKKRRRHNGQLAVQVMPSNLWDHLIFSGIKAEVWMQEGVDEHNVPQHTASIYDSDLDALTGAVSLVLGAGNVSAIAVLDVLHKLFSELEVCLLKLNPVNDYLLEPLQKALKPLIDANALRIVKGDGAVGGWLLDHPLVSNVHITGSVATHDAIVWGTGAAGKERRKKGTPKLDKPITSELGAVTPVIVVPGPWSDTDLRFHAQNLVSQKLTNSGFNCVAGQVYVLPDGWSGTETLMKYTKERLAKIKRPAYYPGALDRMAAFRKKSKTLEEVARKDSPPVLINHLSDDPIFAEEEYFAPVMALHHLKAKDSETYLRDAIKFGNEKLYGTLGVHVMIHPKTIAQIGRERFDEILTDLRYGTICINAYAGLNFLSTRTSWGAFPGHTLKDIQSGIGTVHNTLMFDKPERSIVEAPFYPFPRSFLKGKFSLLPNPPWFQSNRQHLRIAKALTHFFNRSTFLGFLRVISLALRG